MPAGRELATKGDSERVRNHSRLSRNAYNRMASGYDASAEGRFTAAFQTALVSEARVHEGDRILDVACGTGTLLAEFARRYRVEAYGIDIAENMISVAGASHPGVRFCVGDCTAMPFIDGFFDVVTVCAAFHHFGEPERFVREAARVMAPGGRIYIAEVHASPAIRVIANVLLPLSRSGDVRFYAPAAITAMYAHAGLSDCRTRIGGHIQVISAVKP